MFFKASLFFLTAVSAFPFYSLTAIEQTNKTAAQAFHPFPGKIIRSKVRLRLQPNLDGQILRELAQNDLVIVVGEDEGFYAIKPLSDTKAYVYRTYVIDDTIEGDRVNVRLEPNTESPVLAQLNTGDRIEGVISPRNNKWLEIAPPPSVRFFVWKDYVEQISDEEMASKLAKTDQMHNDSSGTKPETDDAAAEIAASLFSGSPEATFNETNLNMPSEHPAHDWNQAFDAGTKTDKMLAWIPVEKDLYESWSLLHNDATLHNYYTEQLQESFVVRGIVEPYHRAIRNKPGDYILVTQETNLPAAYLYSTQIDLEEHTGKTIDLRVAARPNHHFAFPAYFVLAIE